MSENLNNEGNLNNEENLNVNRVELIDGTVLMDITDTTAEPGSVLAGQVFYNAAGTRSTGAYDPTGIIDDTAGAGVTDKTWSANKMTDELDDKADKTDTVLNTTLSRGRKANTTVGTRSFAFGDDVTASNYDSYAEGRMTVSSGTQSHAEGNSTTASGIAAHAEGQGTTASGEQAHAEGGGTTASGDLSHAEGGSTTASGTWSHAEGGGTIASGTRSHAEGQGGTFTVNQVRKTSAAAGANAHSEGNSTLAEGESSHSEGTVTYASGHASHAEGVSTQATGSNSHAEGGGTEASGSGSHAEGGGTHATGTNSHAEGGGTVASGDYAHVEGYATTAAGKSSHVFGENNIIDSYDSWPTWVSGTSYKVGDRVKRDGSNYVCKTANSDTLFVSSKWENPNGKMTYVEIVGNGKDNNNRSNARTLDWQGNETLAGGLTGNGSLAMGSGVNATGSYSQAFGGGTTASGNLSHAEGGGTTASGDQSHAEGGGSRATEGSAHAEGSGTLASGSSSHAEGSGTQATSYTDHAEGSSTTASGSSSHAEGSGTTSSGYASHAEGQNTKAANGCSHAEGYGGTYTKDGVTYTSQAAGYADHVEGYKCLTENHQPGAHAEGYQTRSEGNSTHSEGAYTVAKGNYSHAEGYETIAAGAFSHVSGQYNTADSYDNWDEWVANTSYSVGDKVKRTTTSSGVTTITGYVCKTANSDSSFTSSKWTNLNGQMNYAEIVGNGTSTTRSNARALDWNGNEYLSGDLYVHAGTGSTGGTKVATVSDIGDKVDESEKGVPGGIATLGNDGKVPASQLPEIGGVTYTLGQGSSDGHIVTLTPSAGDTQTITIPDNDTWTELSTTSAGYVGTALPDDDTVFLDGEGNWSEPPYPVTSVAGKTGEVTLAKGDVGLGNVDNTADADKPVSTAVQTALSGKIDSTDKGVANGVAELDSSGKVPASQLPSYVDDVLEYASASNFPAEGETGKIYVALDTNKTYRWGGTEYVEISASLALGETSDTAYRGDRGKTAYDHASAKGSAYTSGLYKITTNSEGHVTGATAVAKSDITALGIPGQDTNTHRPVQLGGTQILGDNDTPLNLIPGNNVSFSYSGGNVTITAEDTTYKSKAAASGGTDLSLVTTGEKYNWNNVIDDTAGDGDTGKTWSADKLVEEIPTFRGGNIDDTAIATFTAEHEGIVNWLKAKVEPVQSGTGDPSPTNVRPISGWTGANIAATGKNILNTINVTEHTYIDVNGTIGTSSNYCLTDYIKIDGTFTMSGYDQYTTWAAAIGFYDENKNFIFGDTYYAELNKTYTPPSGAKYIRVSMRNSYVATQQIEYGTQPTAYEPFGGSYSISFPTSAGTVYGGELTVNADGTGKLVQTHEMVAITSESQLGSFTSNDNGSFAAIVSSNAASDSGTPNILASNCLPISYDDRTASDKKGFARTYVNPSSNRVVLRCGTGNNATTLSELFAIFEGGQFVYPLLTPITYDLSAPQIRTLLGQNNLWCNTGDCSLQYSESVDQGDTTSAVTTGEKANWNRTAERLNTLREQCVPIEVDCGTISSLPATINDSRITATMVCKPHDYIASNESAITSRLTVTTANGSVTLSGSVSGSTTLKIWLYEPEV